MRSNRDEYAKDPLCSNKDVLFLASKVRRGGGGTFTQVKATDLRLGDSMRACSQQQYHNNGGRRRAQQTTFNHPGSSAVARRVSPGLISVEVCAEWKSPTIHHNVPSNGLFGFLDTISCQLPLGLQRCNNHAISARVGSSAIRRDAPVVADRWGGIYPYIDRPVGLTPVGLPSCLTFRRRTA